MNAPIHCMNCRRVYSESYPWYVCNRCGYRVCLDCLSQHSGPYGVNSGNKCSQCPMGTMELKKTGEYSQS